MRIALNLKNTSRAFNPKNNDVIIYDGKEWYVTTKEELLAESNKILDECRQKLEELKEENIKFKKDVSSQLLEMSELIKKLYSK